MFLDVHELEIHRIDFDETLPPGKIELGPGIQQVEPLKVTGSADLIETEIHVEGTLGTTLETLCDRCLEPTRQKTDLGFNLYYRPIQTIARNEEVEMTPDDLDIGFYHGHGMMLEDAVKEQILLSLPMKNICRPDCAGLCPQCGRNRNQGDCGCPPPEREVHWAALKKFSS